MKKKVNIRDIAEMSGSSASTVSRVLSGKDCDIKISDKTKEKIMEVCRKLDYQPSVHASRFFSKESRIVGFLPPQNTFIEDDNLARAMGAVYSQLHKSGYSCMPIVYDENFVSQKKYLDLFKRQEVDALIVWGADDTYDWLEELHQSKKPFILLANRYKGYPAVTCDQQRGTAAMVEQCRSRNATSFAYITICQGDSCQQRQDGFAVASADCETYIIEGGTRIEDGYYAVPEILRLNPDAVICGNDRLAIGVEKGLIEAGIKIPQDIMVTGGDNIEMGQYCQVPLTTFDQMAAKCAENAVDILVDHLQKKTPLTSKIVEPKIIVRQSA